MLQRSWSFKSCDMGQPFDKQPWYTIDSDAIIRDDAGSSIIRLPDVPLARERTGLNNYEDMIVERNWNGSDEFCVRLAEDEYWVMGDNRRDSHDSRSFGPLKKRLIHGKIRFRLISIDTDASWLIIYYLRNPKDFCQRIRWSRCGQAVR